MKNTVDPDSCDSIFHKPRGNPRPKDCLKRALELIDYEACLKEQEATRLSLAEPLPRCCGGTLLSGLCRGPL